MIHDFDKVVSRKGIGAAKWNGMYAEAEKLGLDLPDARIHSPNENMRVEIFEKGIEMGKNMLRLMAQAK